MRITKCEIRDSPAACRASETRSSAVGLARGQAVDLQGLGHEVVGRRETLADAEAMRTTVC